RGILEEMQKRTDDAKQVFADAQKAQASADAMREGIAKERAELGQARLDFESWVKVYKTELEQAGALQRAGADKLARRAKEIEERASDVEKWGRVLADKQEAALGRDKRLDKREAALMEREVRVNDLAETIAPIAAKLGVKL